MTAGFLISCQKQKEEKSKQEILSYFSVITYKPNKLTDDTNYKIELESALENIKKSKFTIKSLKNTPSLYLLVTEEEIMHLFNNLKIKTKFTHRIIPLEKIFTLEEFNKSYESILLTFINKLNLLENVNYKILYEHRNTNKELKEKIMDYLGDKIHLNVDLKNPDWLFVIEVVKNFIGFSVVKNSNFNFKNEFSN